MNEWISVKDEMPDDAGRRLIIADNRGRVDAGIRAVESFGSHIVHWSTAYMRYEIGDTEDYVTHWQYFPDAPEVDDES